MTFEPFKGDNKDSPALCCCWALTMVGNTTDEYWREENGVSTGHHPGCEFYIKPPYESSRKYQLDLITNKTFRFAVDHQYDKDSIGDLSRYLLMFRHDNIRSKQRIDKLEIGLQSLDAIASQYLRSDGSEDEKALEFIRGASYVRGAVGRTVTKILAK